MSRTLVIIAAALFALTACVNESDPATDTEDTGGGRGGSTDVGGDANGTPDTGSTADTDAGGGDGSSVGCGDGVLQSDELCDGDDLGLATCERLGFDSGALACADDCLQFDTAGCETECTPDCSGLTCGPDPVCGISCGSCIEGVCGDDGNCQPTDGWPPEILIVQADAETLTEGETIGLRAIVADRNGLDDIVSVDVIDGDGDESYGAMTAGEATGEWVLSLTWAELHAARAIDFTEDTERTFAVVVTDTASNTVRGETAVTLTCGDGGGACDGTCTDLTTLDNCGVCGFVCESADPLAACVAGTCGCSEGYADCGECLNVFNVGNCGDGCGDCTPEQTCNGFECVRRLTDDLRVFGENDVLEVFHAGAWWGVCDTGFGIEEATVACRQLGGELIDYETGQMGPDDRFWLDGVVCEGTESRLGACDHRGWAHESCGQGQHISISCGPVPRPPRDCETPPHRGGVVINEVFFNAEGADDGQEFVELAAAPGTDLSGLHIVGINGARGNEYIRWTVREGTVDDSGYYVVGGSDVSGVDLLAEGNIQNGPDSVVLEECDGSMIDAVAYGTFEAGEVAVGEGEPVGDPGEGKSIGRDAESTDTDDNFVDFSGYDAPSPGTVNAGRE